MNVVDSSAWLEYFAEGANASFFAGPIEDIEALVVPTMSLFEVFKRVLQQRGESAALQAIAAMQQGTVAELGAELAVRAAALSVDSRVGGGVTAPLPSETRACASNALGSSHGRFAQGEEWSSGSGRMRGCGRGCLCRSSRILSQFRRALWLRRDNHFRHMCVTW